MAKSNSKPVDLDRLPRVIHATSGASEGYTYVEADGGDGKPKLKTFSGIAYTGGPMSVGYGAPVVIDLTGLTTGAAEIAALKDHDPTQIVGHMKPEIGARQIKVSGVVSGVGDAANEVTALSANAFPWQMSVGVAPSKLEFVERGSSEFVNGRKVTGPAYVVRAGELREVSFVAIGADSRTSGRVAAQFNGGHAMTFEQWLEAGGWDASKLTDGQRKNLEAAFKAEHPESAKVEPPAVKAAEMPDVTAQIRAQAAAELARIAAIDAVAKDNPTIRAKAVAEGWDATRTELEVLRASRPTGPAIHTGITGQPITSDVLQAAWGSACGLNVEKDHKPEVLEAAHRRFRGRIGIQQLLMNAAAANGYHCSPGERISDGNLREVLRYAMTPSIQASGGFSTVSLPNILENVANKTLLAGYEEMDNSWREIAEIVSANDFKDQKAYRLLDNMEYEALSPAGEIKHGTVGEQTITRSVDTYAKMFSLTRKMIINDDMGAFAQLPRKLGAGASKAFSEVFWTAFINNSAFFTSGLTNYISGSTTTLLTDGVGLGLAIKAFRQMTTPSADGTKKIGNMTEPRLLLVPPELEGAATALYAANNISNAANGSGNIYFNRFRPVVQTRLSNSSYTGYSTTAWYLFGGTMMQPMWAAFLNGNQSPTVESTEADFNTLGIQFRGYHDFGAGQNEYLAGVKSKGAA